MIYIYVSLLWFVVSVGIHILLNKFRLFLKIPWGVPLIVFIVGLAGCTITTLWLRSVGGIVPSLPLTGVALYVAAVGAYGAVSASPSLGDESPSSKVVLHLLRRGALTEKNIFALFTRQDLITKRLRDLISSGWVREEKGMLMVTPVGMRFAKFFLWLRRVLGMA